jgi:dTDP-4-dehydrorhamnose 3,5-epimerase-like enzyme
MKKVAKEKSKNFNDVFVFTPRVFHDHRGCFYESYNENTFKEAGFNEIFVQDNFSISSYSTIFKDNATIQKNKKNGKIKEWNEKVAIIHKEMWNRFNIAIGKDKNKN